MVKVVTKLLTQKFGSLPQAITDALHSADNEQLDAWIDAVLAADSPDDIF